jgi:hypothetical protein
MRNNEENFAPPPPQQQSYSRPTDFVKLPSKGKFYPPGHPLCDKEEVEVSFMTTKEEDILLSPSYNKKGNVFDKLIESLIVGSVRAESLLIGDKNAILINARKNAYGSDYRVSLICQHCYETEEISIDLDEVEDKNINLKGVRITSNGTFELQLPRTKAKVEIKNLTSLDETELLKKAEQRAKHNLPETPATDRLRQMIVAVNDNADPMEINNFVSGLPIVDSRYIKKKYGEVCPDVDFTYDYECNSCSGRNEGGVPILGTFFWPDD